MKKSIIFIISILSLSVFGFVIKTPNNEITKSDVSNIQETPVLYNPVSEIQSFLTPFDSIVEDHFKSSGMVGAAIAITYKGQIALVKCLGVSKEGENQAIDEHTVFRLASVSKSVTGVLASIVNEESILNLDDKVINYLPELKLKNPNYTEQLTVRNLLSQTSGVIPHAYDLMVEDKVPLEKIITYLDKAEMSAAPGQLYTYQNVVYSIYEPIIEQKMQKDFSDIMNEKVFQPFGMKDASINFESFKKNSNKAYPHVRVDKYQYRKIPLNDRYYNTAPAAGVNASITDMAQLLTSLGGHNKVFSQQASNTIFSPHIQTPVRKKYFKSWGQGVSDISYGIGWRLLNYKGHKVSYHGGYVKGYKAEIALCNEEDLGIAILSNSPNKTTSSWIPTLLNMYFESN